MRRKPTSRGLGNEPLVPGQRIARMSAWRWKAGAPAWGDPHAPAPDPESLEMAQAAALAGWFGIATLLDEHGLRCIAAADGEIAIVTIRGLSMPEAMRVAMGVRLLEDWSIARLCDLVQRSCESCGDSVERLH